MGIQTSLTILYDYKREYTFETIACQYTYHLLFPKSQCTHLQQTETRRVTVAFAIKRLILMSG